MIGSLDNQIDKLFQSDPALSRLLSEIRLSMLPTWLVGGCLRDLLLGTPVNDLDLACAADPTSVARQWAAAVGGKWFWLDRERKQSRVILSHWQVDFALLRAQSIEEDLELRDFTINAMALRLDQRGDTKGLIDPFDGRGSLAKKTLDVPHPDSFLNDPLRMLKGIRHAVVLNFNCSAAVLKLIKDQAEQLKKVAAERVRDELMKILGSPDPLRGLHLMHQTGLLRVVLGPTDGHPDSFDVPLADLVIKLKDIPTDRLKVLTPVVAEEDRTLMLFSELLRIYQPANCAEMLSNGLRFSVRQQRFLLQLSGTSKLPVAFVDQVRRRNSQRVQALLVESIEPFSTQKLILRGLCCERQTLSEIEALCRAFDAVSEQGRVPDLISGERISEFLGIAPGAVVGELLQKIKQAEINGEITSCENAEEWLVRKNSI